MKVANYIADYLSSKGVTDIFTVTGGGAMHLNDAFGHHHLLHSTYNHHEQACAIAAEGYARLTGKIAAVCVTSGPGGTNAITGVLGGWLDSIPMFVVSGQVKRETTIHATDLPMRQLGDQEYDIISSVKPMTKYAAIVLNPADIKYHLEKAWYLANSGRKGPVWLDIPLDVQAAQIEPDELKGFDIEECRAVEEPAYDRGITAEIISKIKSAKRPVILVGNGVRYAGAENELLKLIDLLGIPVVTAWNAHDLVPDSHPLYCGRPGTVGTRGGNFVVANADLLLVLGCRLNIRQISYNYKDFAKDAFKIMVDIDRNELDKPTLDIDLKVHADVKDVIADILEKYVSDGNDSIAEWRKWTSATNLRYPATRPEFYQAEALNPYVFIHEFTKRLKGSDVIVCGNGSACVVTFQAAYVKSGQRLFTNSGCAAMGYGFPSAIGACVARNGHRVVCIDGDGSFQMNIQELQTVVYNHMNLKLIYLNNNGYHSIRQTQTNLFKGELVGVCDGNGLSFPDAEKIAGAYGITFVRVNSVADIDSLISLMEADGPLFAEIVVDPKQNFEPKLSSKVLPDGKIVSPPLDDMFPFLSREEYESNRFES